MSAKVVAAVVGLVLAIGGVVLLGVTVVHMAAGPTYSECVGDGCLDDPAFLGLPAGILGIVFGLIIGGWGLGSLREERGTSGPLSAFGFMSGMGGLFLALGVIFVFAFNSADGTGDGTFLFLGVFFGLMGLAFFAADLVRFRGELKRDRLRVSGLHGSARVVAVHDTNVTINNSPMVRLDLQVTIPGRAPFPARKRVVISRLSVGAMFPGAVIPVLADPAKPTDIVLDWDAMPATTDWSSLADPATMEQTFRALLGGSGNALAGASPATAGGAAAAAAAGMAAGAAGIPTGATGVNAELLRSVSQALASAADRAEHGGASRLADGTTVIDGGTTIMVNGRVVQGPGAGSAASEAPGAAGTGGAGLAGAAAAAAAAAASTAAGAPAGGAGTGSGTGAIDLVPPGAAGGSGLPARVSLDAIQDTGVDMGGSRLYAFDLTVSVAGRQPYQTKHAAVVPAAQVPRLIRGASFPAEVDASQPGTIVVHWDR